MSDRDCGSHLFSFLLGGLIGIAVGLLYAPQSGEQTREKLKETIDELKEKYENIKEKVEESKENIENVVEEAKRSYRKTRASRKVPKTGSESET